jgi:hypothetical protein
VALHVFRIAVGEEAEALPSGHRQRGPTVQPPGRKDIASNAATSRLRNQRKGDADGAT